MAFNGRLSHSLMHLEINYFSMSSNFIPPAIDDKANVATLSIFLSYVRVTTVNTISHLHNTVNCWGIFPHVGVRFWGGMIKFIRIPYSSEYKPIPPHFLIPSICHGRGTYLILLHNYASLLTADILKNYFFTRVNINIGFSNIIFPKRAFDRK